MQQLKKLLASIYYLLKVSILSVVGLYRNEAKNLLTFLYRHYLFSYQGKIPKKTIFEFLKEHNSEFEYIVYNYYPNNSYDQKVSCLGIEESLQLSSLVRFIKPKKLLEIGSNKGGTTYNFYINTSPDCEITSVDLNKIGPANELIKKALKDPRVKLIQTDTKDLLKKLEGQKFDFIFVDAGHDYHEIKNDTEIALKLISQNGLIVWHDYCRLTKEVIQYLDELSQTLKLTHLESGTLVVYKKGHVE